LQGFDGCRASKHTQGQGNPPCGGRRLRPEIAHAGSLPPIFAGDTDGHQE
jgi:hypothetical protein